MYVQVVCFLSSCMNSAKLIYILSSSSVCLHVRPHHPNWNALIWLRRYVFQGEFISSLPVQVLFYFNEMSCQWGRQIDMSFICGLLTVFWHRKREREGERQDVQLLPICVLGCCRAQLEIDAGWYLYPDPLPAGSFIYPFFSYVSSYLCSVFLLSFCLFFLLLL